MRHAARLNAWITAPRFSRCVMVVMSVAILSAGCRGRETTQPVPYAQRRNIVADNLWLSPHSSRIAFQEIQGVRRGSIHVIRLADGKPLCDLPQPPEALDRVCGWSPDGQLLYIQRSLRHVSGTDRYRLLAINPTSGEETPIPIDPSAIPSGLFPFVWATACPLSGVFVVSANARPDEPKDLYVMPLSGGRLELLAKNQARVACQTVFQSGTSRLLVVAQDGYPPLTRARPRLFLDVYPGGKIKALFRPAKPGHAQGGCILEDRFAVIPYRQYPPDREPSEIYVVDLNAAKVVTLERVDDLIVAAQRLGRSHTFVLQGARSLWHGQFDSRKRVLAMERIRLPTSLQRDLTAVEPLDETNVALSTGTRLWTLDLETRRKRLIWKANR